MIGEYSCPYLCNTEKACNKPCIHPESCRFHWKSKQRIPCSDCSKPTASACDRCPDYVRSYYIIQYYEKLRLKGLRSEIGERLRLVIQEIQKSLQSKNMQKETFERIMLTHRDRLANLNITLCKGCLLPIKLKEGEYCDSC